MQTGSDKNNFNPDIHHDTDEQFEDNVSFDDEDLSEEEFNDQKKKIKWSLHWDKLAKQKQLKNKEQDLTQRKLLFFRDCSTTFLCSSLILFCALVILYFATYPNLNNVTIVINILVAFSLATNVITVACYLILRWWSYKHAKNIRQDKLDPFLIWKWTLIITFIICFVFLEIWWILFSVSTIESLAFNLLKLYDAWSLLLGCLWFLFSILLWSYFIAKSLLNKAIELKHLWFWLILICFFVFLVIAYFVFGALALNHESLIPGKALFITACVIGIFGIYPTILNYRLYLNELFY